MTLKKLRELVSATAVGSSHFGELDRLIAWIDWALIPDRGAESEAPWIIWDDDGMIVIREGEGGLALHFGCRREGRWFVVRPLRVLAGAGAVESTAEPDDAPAQVRTDGGVVEVK
jgi:hypothetical protein